MDENALKHAAGLVSNSNFMTDEKRLLIAREIVGAYLEAASPPAKAIDRAAIAIIDAGYNPATARSIAEIAVGSMPSLESIREALEWYADEATWTYPGVTMVEGWTKAIGSPPAHSDQGHRARDALKK